MADEIESLQRIVRLTPVDEVLARIRACAGPVRPQRMDAVSAAGCTLAEDVIVEQPVPEAALALRDGWALQSGLTSDASSYAPAPIATAVRIDAGEPLPSGVDAVAPLDAVMMRGPQAQALAPVAAGEGVLPIGGDLAQGGVLLPAGRRLSRLHVALLAVAGLQTVAIRAPRVRLAAAHSRSDRVFDAVTETVAQAIRNAGGRPVAMPAALPQALTHADADAVVVVGGTGCGQNDNAVATLAGLGQVEVHGIALTPGESAGFGRVAGRPVLLLPGRLDAALAVWHMLGHAMLARLAANEEQACMHPAKLTRKVSSNAGLTELVPVRCEGPFANPLATGYAPMSALAQANGWLLVGAGSEGYQAGSEVMIGPWP